MTKLYFIAGASGCGKSAIISDLKKMLGHDYLVYDFDSMGVPENAGKKWRQETTEKWLKKLLNENMNACLLGQMVLGEVLACPCAKQIEKIHFCLLDVSDFERIKRLKNRNIADANQSMLNWASWLRIHHQDPQWEQHVIKDDCWGGLDFSIWDRLESWDKRVKIEIIDTTGLDILQTARVVNGWIISEKDN